MSRKKNVLVWGGLLIAFFIVLFIVGNINDTRNAVETYEANQKQPHLNEPTRQEMRTSYVDSCVEAGASKTYCACTWDYMIREYGIERVIEIGIEIYKNGGSLDTVPSEFSEAIQHCASEL